MASRLSRRLRHVGCLPTSRGLLVGRMGEMLAGKKAAWTVFHSVDLLEYWMVELLASVLMVGKWVCPSVVKLVA